MTKQQQKSHQSFINWTARLDQFLAEDEILTSYRQTITELQAPIESEVMRVVVIGEVNAGKSSLINALYGEDILSVDSAPCTMSALELPVQHGILFADTPGTNAQVWHFDQIAKACLSKADVVLVVFPAKNPFGQSIWSILGQLHSTGNQRFLFVLQQCDLLSPTDLEATLSYLREYTATNGISRSDFFPISVKHWKKERVDMSGIPTLMQELERFQAALQDTSAILYTRMQSADALLQKIRIQVQARETMIQQSNAYRQEVQKFIESNAQQNKVALVQLEGDFKFVLADLERQVAELSHAEARFQDLKQENRVHELFQIARQRYDSRTQEMLLEYSTQLRDGLQRTSERISKLFQNSNDLSLQISHRTTLTLIDIRLDQTNIMIRSGVHNTSTGGDALDKIALESGVKSRLLCKKARQKFLLTALLPVILLLFFTAVLPATIQIIEAVKDQTSSSSSSNSDSSENLLKSVAGMVTTEGAGPTSDSSFGLWLSLICGLVIVLAGTAYIAAVKKATDAWLLMQLRSVGLDAHEALRQALPTMQSAFCSGLQKTLEESETMLMGIISDFLDKNKEMADAAEVGTQLDALSVLTSDLHKMRM